MDISRSEEYTVLIYYDENNKPIARLEKFESSRYFYYGEQRRALIDINSVKYSAEYKENSVWVKKEFSTESEFWDYNRLLRNKKGYSQSYHNYGYRNYPDLDRAPPKRAWFGWRDIAPTVEELEKLEEEKDTPDDDAYLCPCYSRSGVDTHKVLHGMSVERAEMNARARMSDPWSTCIDY